MTAVRRLLTLAAALSAAVALGGCALSLQSLPKLSTVGSGTYPVRAAFANVLNLPADAQVRLGAEVIGQVSSISTADFQADLTLSIKDGVRLPAGTTAQVRFDDPLGDEYVLLQPPVGSAAGGGFLQPNALIGAASTSTAASVEDTFGALSLVLNGGGLNQLQVIIHELNDTFDGNQPQIRSFLHTIEGAVATVTGGRATIDAALSSIDRLTHQLAAGRGTIATGIDTIGPAVGVLASENSQISKLLVELTNLGSIGSAVARQSGENSVADVRDLLPVVEQLESVSQQIGPDLKDLAAFEAATPKIAPGDYLQVKATLNVLLPSGAYEPDSFGTTAAGAESGSQAVSTLLEGGLL